MKRIVVLGASIAGVKAIEKIKEQVPDCECTIVSFDNACPYDRRRFVQIIGKSEKAEALYYKPKDYYEKNGITLRPDTKVTRINFNRNKIFTEDKDHIDYDILIIAGLPAERYPDIKGTNKNNLFHLNKLGSLRELYDMLPIAESVVVQSERVEGMLMALACARHNCDVHIVTNRETLLPQWFNDEAAKALLRSVADQRLNIQPRMQIAEVLGEGDAKAVRLSSNKVLASDATLFADAPGDTKIFTDSELAVNEGIVVDENFKSNLDNVYALDQACEMTGASQRFPKTIAQLEYEGERAAAAITAQEYAGHRPLGEISLDLEGMNIICLGDFDSNSSAQEKTYFEVEPFVYKRLLIDQGRPVAAILVNAPDKKEIFERLLKGETDLSQIETEFPQPALVAAESVPQPETPPEAPEQAAEGQQVSE